MRYRSAAFALKSAHALAGVGSTHFPALGVDADALLSPAAVLYLLRFSSAAAPAQRPAASSASPACSFVLFAKMAREVLSDGTGLTLACVLRFDCALKR